MIGSLPQWASRDEQLLALEALERDIYAASTLEAIRAKLRTIKRALAGWGRPPFPPTVESVRELGASLKHGGYRSAASYLWLYKVESQRRGHAWVDPLQRALKDCIRSCERGLGPPFEPRHSPSGSSGFCRARCSHGCRAAPSRPETPWLSGRGGCCGSWNWPPFAPRTPKSRGIGGPGRW